MQSKQFIFSLIFFAVLLVFLQYRLWFESGGILEEQRLKKQLAVNVEENNKLKKRNQAILQQVKSLKNNADTVESSARQELGMIKNGETFYQVVQ